MAQGPLKEINDIISDCVSLDIIAPSRSSVNMLWLNDCMYSQMLGGPQMLEKSSPYESVEWEKEGIIGSEFE